MLVHLIGRTIPISLMTPTLYRSKRRGTIDCTGDLGLPVGEAKSWTRSRLTVSFPKAKRSMPLRTFPPMSMSVALISRSETSSMDNLRFVAERDSERFEIVECSGQGFYVFRYTNGQNTHDYLQDDAPMALRCAEDEWGVSPEAWREPLPNELPLWKQS